MRGLTSAILIGTVVTACGSNNDDANGTSDNGSSNNTTTVSNNATTATNNAASNNGASNNATTNNANTATNGTNGTNANNSEPPPYDCSLQSVYVDRNADPRQLNLNELDENDRATRMKWDRNGDGVWDFVEDFEYDADGRVVRNRQDFDADGTHDREVTTEYDDLGNETAFRLDSGANGRVDYERLSTYDQYGRLIEYTRDGVLASNQSSVEESADGTIDYRMVWEWAGPGFPLPILENYDVDGDGTYDVTSTAVSTDGQGRPTDVEFDGAVLSANTNWPNGNPRRERDLIEAADGTVDFRMSEITYDAEGRPIRHIIDGRFATDGSYSLRAGEGEPIENTVQYGEDGSLTRHAWDVGSDGTEDFVQTWTFDAVGNLLRREVDGVVDNGLLLQQPADGSTDYLYTAEFEPADTEDWTREAATIDIDGDGNPEFAVERERTPDGQPTLFRVDGDVDDWEVVEAADGVWDRETVWTYDQWGRIVEHVYSENGEELTYRTWEYGYCPQLL